MSEDDPTRLTGDDEPTPVTAFGRYRVLGEIGSGAMAVVYRAHDPRIDRTIALKVIGKDRYRTTEDEPEPQALARFWREARAAGKLSHPGIVTVYDVGEQGANVFIAMELVEGVPLREKMRGGPLSIAEAADIVARTCEALAYAHAHGVVHRDVKPDNILCLADGSVKLADFGIARVTAADATVSGKLLGTPRYMAPEQWRQEPVDGRTDLYALGVVLYELVTGAPPFAARVSTELMFQVLNEDPPPPSLASSDVPPALDAIVRRALARDPADRYPTAADMAQALEPLTGVAPEPRALPRRSDRQRVDAADAETSIPRSAMRAEPARAPERTRGGAPAGTRAHATHAGADVMTTRSSAAHTVSSGNAPRYAGEAGPDDATVVGARAATAPRPAPARWSLATGAGVAALGLATLAVVAFTLLRQAPPARVPETPAARAPVEAPRAVVEPPAPAARAPEPAPQPEPVRALPPRYQDAIATLVDAAVDDEAKIAVVDELARDAGDDATAVLLSSLASPSTMVSMASIKAVGGRPCDRIAAPLAALLDHREWQRRAWAAKVLGESGCAAAAERLRERAPREEDARVRQRLDAALRLLAGEATS